MRQPGIGLVHRIAAAAVAVASVTASLSAFQPSRPSDIDPAYLTLLRQYAAGGIRESVLSLAQWPQDRVGTAVRALRASGDLTASRIAAVFHTETAFVTNSDRLANFHIGVAQTLLPDAAGARDRTFTARWHGLAAISYAVRRNEVQARRHINLGIGVNAKNKDVQLARGILEELAISDVEHNLRGTWRPEATGKLESRLKNAAEAYGMALQSDPEFADARLRLGWVLFLNHSSAHARTELQQLIGDRTRDDVRHLAHLFLGAIADREKRLDAAAVEYAAAHAVMPTQTSFIALMQVLAMLGRDDELHAVASAFAAHSPGRDPWWEFNEGLTSGELVEWLRREAARP